MRKRLVFIGIDLLIFLSSYFIFAWIKPGTKDIYILGYYQPLSVFTAIWVVVSFLIEKYSIYKKSRFRDIQVAILISNFTILSIISILIYFFNIFYSRLLVFGSVLLATAIEMVLSYMYFSFLSSQEMESEWLAEFGSTVAEAEEEEEEKIAKKITAEQLESLPEIEKADGTSIRTGIVEEVGEEACNYIARYVDFFSGRNAFVATTTRFNILQLPSNHYTAIINLKRINDIQRINKFFEGINTKLPVCGLFIGWVDTNALRKEAILKGYPLLLNYLVYFFDFLFRRVMPKLTITKKLYFFITKGRNRAMSKTETLGRLYSCGFEVVDEATISHHVFFVVRKIKDPVFDYNPTYGPIIKLRRLGKGGKEIRVYKMRTMHAYSEYLQNYIFDTHNLEEGGKFKDDFRVTTTGKIMRKFWLDEVPMLINLLKGDLKIVGVRPLSKHYFSLYTPELQQRRLKYRPGLVPPFYVDMPKTLEEIMASEMKYLESYEKHPFITDVTYFFKAFYNILFRHARSA